MKISCEWLGEYLQPVPDAQAAGEALTHGGLPVESIEKAGTDTVIDVEVTSNRSDCLCHVGVARELVALKGGTFKEVLVEAPEIDQPVTDAVRVEISSLQLCPHYTARLIRGVRIGPSPQWLVRRLEAVGIRPISNVVDVTNYVMMELGQPLHAFDFAKISGGRIVVRTAQRGETIVSLDGRKRELAPGMLVIADARNPAALAGVMGGLDTEVSEGTTDVLLESARFDPLSIRRTARALAMKSDSSYRFERGIDPTLPVRASLRAAQLILQTAGGTLLRGIAQAGSDQSPPRSISVRFSRLKQILGIELPPQDVINAFSRLSFSPVLCQDRIDVTVPSHRLDVNREIDLIEEAARVLGYDRIPTRQEISIRLTPPDPATLTHNTICDTLVASGFFEAVTFSFVSDSMRSDFGASNLRADSAVRKADASLRPSLLPGLLEAVALNQTNGTPGAKLFEIGSVFAAGDGAKINEQRAVAMVGGADVRVTRGVVEAVLGKLDAQRNVRVEPEAHVGFAAGACGRVYWGDEPVGFLGKIDRKISERLSLHDVPTAAELQLAPLLAGAKPVALLKELARFPSVRRDLSLVVKEGLRFEEIQTLVQKLELPFLEGIEFITTYRGKPLESGDKSVTISLIFRSPSATLTSEQVEESVQKAAGAAKEKLGATLRT
jgi:phenylalanyl-tRNA synthetase beta chain